MSYRNDFEAAKLRRNVLARELADVRQQIQQLEGLRDRSRVLERELEQSGRDVDRARAKVALPLLQRVRVASPCNERWEYMTGDERVRHCQRCDKKVYDLSALDSAQAEALLQEHGESLCARFYRRRDGTVMTADCPVGSRKRRVRRGAVSAVSAVAAVAVGAMAAVALSSPVESVVMGDIMIVPEPSPVESMVMGNIMIVPEPLVEDVAHNSFEHSEGSNVEAQMQHSDCEADDQQGQNRDQIGCRPPSR